MSEDDLPPLLKHSASMSESTSRMEAMTTWPA